MYSRVNVVKSTKYWCFLLFSMSFSVLCSPSTFAPLDWIRAFIKDTSLFKPLRLKVYAQICSSLYFKKSFWHQSMKQGDRIDELVGDLWDHTTNNEIFVLSFHLGKDSEVGNEEYNGGLMPWFTLQLFQVLVETLDKPLQHCASASTCID